MEEFVRERLQIIRGRVAEALSKGGRGAGEVRILVAGKYYSPEQIAALSRAGVELLGENRAEELLEKQAMFGDAFEWHFIGHLQRRKAKQVVGRITLVHSVDSERLIQGLAGRAPKEGADVLI